MIKRNRYLEKIRSFYNVNDLIKIIYGLRRCGKSVILSQIINEIKQSGIEDDHIIYINFESLEYSYIKDIYTLNDFVLSKVNDSKTYYLFIDEIQEISSFEKVINSLRATGQFSIFITGSNSRLTFSEISTILSGRYVSFRINPLVFSEIVELTSTKEDDYEKLLYDIFTWGSLPQRFMFTDENSKISYINDVYNSIILKDIVDKLKIKDITSFNKILQYLLETETREFSANNIIEYLQKENSTISTQTLYQYLEALCGAFIINKVNRYDVKGKSVLKTLNKYYVSDLGIKQIKSTNKENNYSINLENIVYNELIFKGYEVYTGKTNKGEIDFIAKKNNITKYIQVTYRLDNNESTIEREFNAFNYIDDNYEKYVISLDKFDYSRNGIKNINIFDFLMNNDF